MGEEGFFRGVGEWVGALFTVQCFAHSPDRVAYELVDEGKIY